MSNRHTGNIQPQLDLEEHDGANNAKRVSIVSSTAGGLTNIELRAIPVPISGTVTVDTSLLATHAKQDTGNTSVGSIDTKTPALGQALAASSSPVVLTAAQVTTLTPPAAITGFATSALQTTQDTSINALLKPANTLTGVTTVSTVTSLTQMNGAAISMNTGVRDAGTQRVTIATNDVVPVTGTFFQTTQPVSETAATLPAATTMQNAAVANGNGTTLAVSGYAVAIISIISSPAMSGGTTINFECSQDDATWVSILAHQMGVSGSQGVTSTTDGSFRLNVAGVKSVRTRISAYSAGTITIKGYPTPVTGQGTTVGLAAGSAIIGSLTANQSVNVAQMNGATTPIGAGVEATALRVTLPTDGTGVVTTKKALTASAPTFATVAATSGTAVASNANRKGLILVNTSANIISLGFAGAAAVLNSGVTLAPYGSYEMNEYSFTTGAVTAIASVASSNLAFNEFTT